MLKKIFKLIFFLAVCEVAGLVGAVFTMPAIKSGWYASLVKPNFAPPNWLFAPVWTALFVLMGVAAFLVESKVVEDSKKKKEIKVGLTIFFSQLVLNVFWSVIFFGWRSLTGGLVEIVFLWLAILATMVAFARVSKVAAWLLAPYLFWVSFAAYLNYVLLRLN